MVSSIEIRAGECVNQIALWMASGECQVFGKHGGHEEEPFELDPDEYIVEVTGRRTEEETSGIQFLTNKDRLSPWYGKHRGEQFRFQTSRGNCLSSFAFDENFTITGMYDIDVEDTRDAFELSKYAVRAELLIILTHRTKIIFRAKATGSYVRLLEDMTLDGEGKDKDDASQFIIHQISFKSISLESMDMPGNFLRITEATGFDCGGSSPNQESTTFTV